MSDEQQPAAETQDLSSALAAGSTERPLPPRRRPQLFAECDRVIQRQQQPAERFAPQPVRRCADDRGQLQTSASPLAAKNNLLKAEVELLVDRLAEVTAENSLLMRRIRSLRRQTGGGRNRMTDGASGSGTSTQQRLTENCVDEETNVDDDGQETENDIDPPAAATGADRAHRRPRSQRRVSRDTATTGAASSSAAPSPQTAPRLSQAPQQDLLSGPTPRCPPPAKERSPSPSACLPPPPPTLSPGQQKGPNVVDGLTENGGSDVDLEDVVFVVGDALLDVCADVDQLFLTKYGLNADDVILARPEHKDMLCDLHASWSPRTFPGGSSQNSARVLQWMLGVNRLTTMFACIGADEVGDQLADVMRKAGVNLRYAVDSREPTGICCVCSVGSHTSMVTRLGASASLGLDHLRDPGTRRLMQRAELFYVEGFGVGHAFDVINEVAEYATHHNVPLAFNLAARYVCTEYKDAMRQIVEHADIVFGNRTEARAFAVAQRLPADGVAEIARLIAALPKTNGSRGRIVVVTNGDQPTVVAENGTVRRYPVVTVNPEELVDTVGAGDAFCGGFLAGLVTGADVSRCVALGHLAARSIVSRKACDLPVGQPPLDNIDLTELKQRRRIRSCDCSNAAASSSAIAS